eukprot:12788137-Alexandrium_andersonii.AAC.1
MVGTHGGQGLSRVRYAGAGLALPAWSQCMLARAVASNPPCAGERKNKVECKKECEHEGKYEHDREHAYEHEHEAA